MENITLEKSEQEKIQILRENLKILDVLDKYSILGHGTDVEVAKKILAEGLQYLRPYLQETTIGLFDSQLSIAEQKDQVFQNILNWPHRGHKSIVIIAIPNVPKGETGGDNYFNSVFETVDGFYHVVSPEFIKGYIDVNTLQFVANPKYDPDKKVTVKDCSSGDFLDAHKGQKEHHPVPSPSENNEDVW